MAPVADISETAASSDPPELRQDPDWVPRPMTSTRFTTEDGHRWPTTTPQVGEYPALHVSDSAAVLPQQQAHLAAADLIDSTTLYASRRSFETCLVAGSSNSLRCFCGSLMFLGLSVMGTDSCVYEACGDPVRLSRALYLDG